MLQLFWMVKVIRTFREGNKVIDGSASMAFSKPIGKYFYMQQLDEILLLLHDYSEVTWLQIV